LLLADVRNFQALSYAPDALSKDVTPGAYNQVTPTISKYWTGPGELASFTAAEHEAYDCVMTRCSAGAPGGTAIPATGIVSTA
jgi:hypothetical protein